jgi:hypothetical protein
LMLLARIRRLETRRPTLTRWARGAGQGAFAFFALYAAFTATTFVLINLPK